MGKDGSPAKPREKKPYHPCRHSDRPHQQRSANFDMMAIC